VFRSYFLPVPGQGDTFCPGKISSIQAIFGKKKSFWISPDVIMLQKMAHSGTVEVSGSHSIFLTPGRARIA